MSTIRFDILTTFPELFAESPGCALNSSIPARARAAGIAEWHASNIRDFTSDKHQKTDDRPFGGGPGMVMMCQPLWDAVHAVEARDPRPATRILLTPQGVPLTQAIVEHLSAKPRLLLIAGHYEGIDERVIHKLEPMEISVGDFVLSGGELAAMILIDAIIRLLPGALGDEASATTDSFSPARPVEGISKRKQPAGIGERLLDCPHFTRPREWMGMVVPDVLLSGNHAQIEAWRLTERFTRTQTRRPELLLPAQKPIDSPGTAPKTGPDRSTTP